MNNNPYFAGLDKIDTPVNSNSRLFDPQPLSDWFNSFKQKPLTPMQQGYSPNVGAPTKMPMFSDMESIVTPQPVGAGTVLSTQPNQPMEMFKGAGHTPQGAGMGTPSDGTVEPIFPSLAQPQAVQPVQPVVKPLAVTTPGDVTQPQATQMFTSMYGGNPAEAYSTEALAANTAPIEGTTGSTNLMEFFGLSDMTGKDMLAGAGAALQTGLGAYGMFKTLGQMDTRLDQGQQQIDLSREEYEENLRHRQAIVAQNKGA